MSASNFDFLKAEWPELYDSAVRGETTSYSDPRAACFYARRSLELAVHWLYKHDTALSLPYNDNLSSLITEPTFRRTVAPGLATKAHVIKDFGNMAVHSQKVIREADAISAVRELFHFCFWVARSYSRGTKPADGTQFDVGLLPKTTPVPQQTMEQLQRLEASLREKDEKLADLLQTKTSLDEELLKLRAEVAAAKKTNATQPDTHDYSEDKTRVLFIDLLLKEAGWALDQERASERHAQSTGPGIRGLCAVGR